MGITLCWIGIILTPALIGPILLILGVPLAHKGLIDFQHTEEKTSSLIVVTLTFAYIVAAIVTVILVCGLIGFVLDSGF
jgi:xanthine/uracil permease